MMKNLAYILLLISQFSWAQDAFVKGNNFYEKENYEQAIQQYELVLKEKKHSAELYFNLGNAYYKLNKTAPAIYNFEKALLLNPGFSDAKNNLQFAQNRTIDAIKPVEKTGFNNWFNQFLASHTHNGWATIAVAFSILFLLFFIGYYFTSKTWLKRTFFTLLLLSFVAMIVMVSLAFAEKSRFENDRPAIVFQSVLVVKAEPKENATDAFIIHEGTRVQVLEELNNWQKIQLADEKEGWVLKNAVKEIK
ncbi:tetratricopeptide repeat protein [Flavobacterium ichthyis]|nr:tetratricopeptide repeat protein [Flavobacterium ichthyis]